MSGIESVDRAAQIAARAEPTDEYIDSELTALGFDPDERYPEYGQNALREAWRDGYASGWADYQVNIAEPMASELAAAHRERDERERYERAAEQILAAALPSQADSSLTGLATALVAERDGALAQVAKIRELAEDGINAQSFSLRQCWAEFVAINVAAGGPDPRCGATDGVHVCIQIAGHHSPDDYHDDGAYAFFAAAAGGGAE